MTDERFAHGALAGFGPNTPAADALAEALAREIAPAEGKAVDGAVRQAAEKLRRLENDLRQFEVGGCRHTCGPNDPLLPEGGLAVPSPLSSAPVS